MTESIFGILVVVFVLWFYFIFWSIWKGGIM